MKANDSGVEELLELFRTHPELINALVFNPASVKRLLGPSGRRILSADTKAFLRHVIAPKSGGPTAVCLRGTSFMCGGGTKVQLGLGERAPTPGRKAKR